MFKWSGVSVRKGVPRNCLWFGLGMVTKCRLALSLCVSVCVCAQAKKLVKPSKPKGAKEAKETKKTA